MWLQGVPGWPHGDETRSLEGQNSEIADSYTVLIHFTGLRRVRGERVQARGYQPMRPFGFAREEELNLEATWLEAGGLVAEAAWLQCGYVGHWAQ